jgi:hypothetical protein
MALTQEELEFLQKTPRSFRMVDMDGNVCKFIKHALASVKVAVVEYPDGKVRSLRLRTEVGFEPFKHIPG